MAYSQLTRYLSSMSARIVGTSYAAPFIPGLWLMETYAAVNVGPRFRRDYVTIDKGCGYIECPLTVDAYNVIDYQKDEWMFVRSKTSKA